MISTTERIAHDRRNSTRDPGIHTSHSPAQIPRTLPEEGRRRASERSEAEPEYLEADEVNAIIRAAPNLKAKLLMLEQWRAGFRVSEALDLEVRDLSLNTLNPTIGVRDG